MLEARVRSEYAEMPGLLLTIPQATRLFGMSPAACEDLLADLVRRGILESRPGGRYGVREPSR